MGLRITYTSSLKDIAPAQLRGFFAGWPRKPSPKVHVSVLRGSDYCVLAVDPRTDNVIGFITAISDGVLCAYITFLEVLPGYRDHGVGSELVNRLLKKLSGLYMIDLICDKGVRPFYRRLGMSEASGMIVRNRKMQSGKRS